MKDTLHPIAKKHGYKTNKAFYADYPTPESYEAKYGRGGAVGDPNKPWSPENPSGYFNSLINTPALQDKTRVTLQNPPYQAVQESEDDYNIKYNGYKRAADGKVYSPRQDLDNNNKPIQRISEEDQYNIDNYGYIQERSGEVHSPRQSTDKNEKPYGKGGIVKPVNNINPSASVIKNRAMKHYALGDAVSQGASGGTGGFDAAGMISGAIGQATDLLPTNEVDGQQFKTTGATILGGVAKGAAAGAMFGLPGILAGGVLSGIGAAFKADKIRTAESEARTAYNTKLSRQVDPTQQLFAQGDQVGAAQAIEVENNELRLTKKPGGGWKLANDYDGKSHAEGGIKTVAQEGDMIVRKDLAEKAKGFIKSNDQVALNSLLRQQHADKEKAEFKEYRQFVKNGGQIIKKYAYGDPVEINGLTPQYDPWGYGQQAAPNYMPQAPVQSGVSTTQFGMGQYIDPNVGLGSAQEYPNATITNGENNFPGIDPNASAPPPMMHQRLGLNENNVPTIPIQNRQSYNVSNPVTNVQPGGVTYAQLKQDSVNNAPILKTLTPPPSQPGTRQKFDPTNLLAYGSSAYNIGMGLSKAEQVKPNYANYGAAKSKLAERKYDISSILAQNRTNASTQASNLRNSGNIGGGDYRSNLTQIGVGKSAADSAAYGEKNNVENQYRADEANLFTREAENRQGAENMARGETNANRVTKQQFMAAGLGQVQQTALNQRYMRDQKGMDSLRVSMLKEIYPQFNGTNYPEMWNKLKEQGYTDAEITGLKKYLKIG